LPRFGAKSAVGIVLASVLMVACGGETPTPPPPPARLLLAAPRTCPLPLERADSLPANQIVDAMDGHLPHWFPGRWGLAGAWSDGHGGSWATWADARCREVTVFTGSGSPDGLRSKPHVGPWTVTDDVSRGCGNAVLGMGTCLGYETEIPSGQAGVQMMGLERPEADRIVRSIPL
jgi:hypothetical protein